MGTIIVYGLLIVLGLEFLRLLATPPKRAQPVVYIQQESTRSQGSGSLLLALIGIALIIFVAIA
jgi:hypothetical protein